MLMWSPYCIYNRTLEHVNTNKIQTVGNINIRLHTYFRTQSNSWDSLQATRPPTTIGLPQSRSGQVRSGQELQANELRRSRGIITLWRSFLRGLASREAWLDWCKSCKGKVSFNSPGKRIHTFALIQSTIKDSVQSSESFWKGSDL